MTSTSTTMSPFGYDRVISADQLFARLRAGERTSDAAVSLGISRGQARRMIAAYRQVGRDSCVHAQIDAWTGSDDPCRTAGPESGRAFDNTEDLVLR